jgi:hypothetical protein
MNFKGLRVKGVMGSEQKMINIDKEQMISNWMKMPESYCCRG